MRDIIKIPFIYIMTNNNIHKMALIDNVMSVHHKEELKIILTVDRIMEQ